MTTERPTTERSTTERRAPLDRTRVAETALALLNDVGLEGLTLRAIAKELDVKAPALYWHFKDKQALLDEMATVMFRRMEASTPLDPDATWQDRIRAACVSLRAALLSYRDGAKVFSGSRFTGTEHAVRMEENLRFFLDAGFSLADSVRAYTTATNYTIGFVIEEQGVVPLPGERREGYDIDERARRLAEFPLSAAAGSEIFADYERHFAEGVEIIVDGIAARYRKKD
ncbi:TetR/AcrR family transcriptional regulator C-terminal domain-containing protein [Streptomyces sp. S6]